MADLDQETLTYHLSELRKTIISIVVCLVVLFPIGYFLAPYCIDWLVQWSFPVDNAQLNFFSPMEVFILNLKIGFVLALVLGFPYIIYKIWQFLLPALYDKEKKFVKTAVFCSTFLFVLGAAMCIGFVLPLIMKFSMSFATEQIKPPALRFLKSKHFKFSSQP